MIEENYFEDLDGDKLDQDSVSGMVDDLRKRYDDRFSHYFDPRSARGVQRPDAAASSRASASP